ncbi:PH domain-containing protein [Paeniglutamicibacter gangotriensis]|uniref:Membrane-flanked domain-containing protein n=1 Tax=Paeniglutamicibacter gangotriensis Lz1y TaxID=1276920 RepID=M7NDU7_9MICC|nr:PH domain-containing protein [Paeniglutamicibacter gangotriensis]EMQ99999.1 membrane-flanked domain-containing protein [Paeniglutamicibacter gangotriensis Lz1y]
MSDHQAPEPHETNDLAPVDTPVPWRRVHPVSPLVRGWLAVVAIAFVYGQNTLSSFFGDEEPTPGPEMVSEAPLMLSLLIGAGVLVLILLGFFLSWRFTKYQITERHVNVNSGIVFRQQRQARIDRVQSIDIAQPLVARIFGLAELRFDVADSGSAAMNLAFVKLSEAHQLRNEILARAAGLKDPAAPAPLTEPAPGHGTGIETPPEAPQPAAAQGLGASERVVAAVPVGRLIGSILLRPSTMIMIAGLIGLGIGMSMFEGFAPFYLLPAFLGMAGALWNNLNTGYNFKAAASADGLRLSYGLLDTRHQTVPPGRVAAIKVSAPFFWRKLGWYKVAVNVAGIGGAGNEAQERSVLLPVGSYEDVLAVLSVVLPDPGVEAPREFFASAINGAGTTAGFVVSPTKIRPLSPLAYKRQGYALTDTALVARNGALHRTLAIVPHARTQGLMLRQGPLARRFGVLDLSLATISGPVSPLVHQLDVAVGRELFLEQADRAAAARKQTDSNHWLGDA